jgi:hypothetical protein
MYKLFFYKTNFKSKNNKKKDALERRLEKSIFILVYQLVMEVDK